MFKSKFSIIGFSFLNAVLMTVFTFFWVNNSFITTDDEEFMIRLTSGLKSTFFKVKEKPNPDEFLFIDIAFEKQLVDEKNELGERIGKRPITNRQRIAELLSNLNKTNQHKFIVLDVFLKDSSDFKSDSSLQEALSKTKNILIPYHMGDSGKADLPMFSSPVALSDYDNDEIDNNFIKFKSYYNDTVRTTPLVMYEMLHGNKFKNHGLFGSSNGSLALSSFILDLRIWSENIGRKIEKKNISDTAEVVSYPIYYLSDILCDFANPSLIKSKSEFTQEDTALYAELQPCIKSNIEDFTKNRIIVIGDFSDADIHETIYGATPGPLILLNIYLALREGDNLFSVLFILFLLTGFYFISYNCFKGRVLFNAYFKKLSKKIKFINKASFMLNLLSYILFFIILSVLSFFLFNIHITILLLAIYMEVLEKLIDYFQKRNAPEGAEDLIK